MEAHKKNDKIVTPLNLTQGSVDHLTSIRRWALFLSTIGFVTILVFLGIGAFIGSSFSLMSPYYAIPGEAILGFYLIIGVLYLIPILHLIRFSANIRKAINGNPDRVEIAFKHLRRMFISFSILTLILLLMYPAIVAGGYLSYLPNL